MAVVFLLTQKGPRVRLFCGKVCCSLHFLSFKQIERERLQCFPFPSIRSLQFFFFCVVSKKRAIRDRRDRQAAEPKMIGSDYVLEAHNIYHTTEVGVARLGWTGLSVWVSARGQK